MYCYYYYTSTTGVYYGWASVDGGPVYKAVTSVGWNPQFMNEKKSVEVMLLKTYRQLLLRLGGSGKSCR